VAERRALRPEETGGSGSDDELTRAGIGKGGAELHRPDGRARLVREHESLDGGEVMPGFTVALGELFRGMP
jgi:hypothetical protein